MTLWRQICITISVLLSLVFVGTFVISTHTMHRYLINQMGSHAQDTATALGVAISKDFAAGDMISVNRTLDAVFDRGYYKRINLQTTNKQTIYDNVYRDEEYHAPRWFAKLVNIPALEAAADILAGWRNAGSVRVTSNPDYGYLELWKICSYNFWWFLSCGLVVLSLALLVLHKLLSPLRYIVAQAEAIVHRNFLIQDTLPVTKEFRVVVETMNKMSLNLKEMFFHQVEFSAAMRERSYKDMLTGLGNKNYFVLQLEYMLSSTKNDLSNGLFLLRLAEMDKYRSKWGSQASEEVLKNIAALLTTLPSEHNVLLLAHLNNYDFAVVIINIGHHEAEIVAANLLAEINNMAQISLAKEIITANIAGLVFIHDGSTKNIMEQAENVLLAAQQLGTNQVCIKDFDQPKAQVIIEDWSNFLRNKVSEKDVMFHYQPVFCFSDGIILPFHNEALLRLKGPNREVLPSGLVIPMVEKFKLGATFDRLVIKAVIERIIETPHGSQCYGINISRAALQDKDFILWLSECCARAGASISRLHIELAENLVRDHLTAVQEFFACIRIYGLKVGIDHFGRGFSSFAYLNALKVDYIKIDGSYSRSIDTSVEDQMIVRSFVEMGHGLGLTVIATSVETEAARDMLISMHIDGMQGYLISPPA